MYRGKVRETFELSEFVENVRKVVSIGWREVNVGNYTIDGIFVLRNNCLMAVLTFDEYKILISSEV